MSSESVAFNYQIDPLLMERTGAALVGTGVFIEQRFEKGRQVLSTLQVPIEAPVVIASMQDGRIILEDAL